MTVRLYRLLLHEHLLIRIHIPFYIPLSLFLFPPALSKATLFFHDHYPGLLLLPQLLFSLFFLLESALLLEVLVDVPDEVLVVADRSEHSEVVLVHGCGLLELVGEDEEHLEGVEGRERDAKDGDPTLEVLLDQADRLVVDAELEQSLARHEGVV